MGELKITALLTPKDVAERLSLKDKNGVVSETKAWRLIRQGKIPKVAGLGRLVRVDPAVLEKLYFSGADKIKR